LAARSGRGPPAQASLLGPEFFDLARALPQLFVVTDCELLGVFLSSVIVRTKKFDCPDEMAVYANDAGSILCHSISPP
jgi:hypothetical protein